MRLLPLRRVQLSLCLAVASVVVGTSSLWALQGGTEDGQWRVYHGDYVGNRYSPLDQINANNFNDLEIAWRWKAENFGPNPEIKNEVTPLMIDGVLFVQQDNDAPWRRSTPAQVKRSGLGRWTRVPAPPALLGETPVAE